MVDGVQCVMYIGIQLMDRWPAGSWGIALTPYHPHHRYLSKYMMYMIYFLFHG